MIIANTVNKVSYDERLSEQDHHHRYDSRFQLSEFLLAVASGEESDELHADRQTQDWVFYCPANSHDPLHSNLLGSSLDLSGK